MSKIAPIETLIDSRKCKKHRAWIKKGICALCYLEDKKKRKEYEQQSGSNKPPVVIRNV